METDGGVLRARIDYEHKNRALRDPVLYRITAGGLFPTYDFACPVVDAMEGVTHALRDIQYRDRRPLYEWVQTQLKLKRTTLVEFSRLSFKGLDLSKRKMKQALVEHKMTDWADPRLPTLRGFFRRGLRPEALIDFVKQLGIKSTVKMELDKLWTLNKKLIDASASRCLMIPEAEAVEVQVEAFDDFDTRQVPIHPSHRKGPHRPLLLSPDILVPPQDANLMKNGEVIMLMQWGRFKVKRGKMGGIVVEKVKGTDAVNRFVNWVPRDTCQRYTVFDVKGMELAPTVYLGESYLNTVKVGAEIQIFRDKGCYCKKDGNNEFIRFSNGRLKNL
jgi:glutamyl-tRNA synthetase